MTRGIKINKKILIYLTIALVITLSSVLVFFSVNKYKPLNKTQVEGGLEEYFEDEPSKTTSGYDLENAEHEGDGVYNISNDAYNNYTNFIITNLDGLKGFMGIVNGDKRNFKGKKVYLNRDINCGGANITIGFTWYGPLGGAHPRYFQGDLFDGNNHTITNFKIHYFYPTNCSSFNAYGFFTRIGEGTKIKNLCLKNFTGPSASDTTVVGGLVGYTEDGAVIENCIVDSFTSSAKSAGIIGQILYKLADAKKVEIKNCLINKGSMSTGIVYGVSTQAAMFSHSGDPTTYVTNCVVSASCTLNALPYASEYTPKMKLSGCVSTADTTTGLSCSSIGGNTSSQSTTWYYGGPQYNGGFPYLRQFIASWKYVYFAASNGTVDTRQILMPSDASEPTTNSTSTSITIFNRKVTATSSLCHSTAQWARIEIYEEWGISIYRYKCTFSPATRTVKFVCSMNTTLSVNRTNQTAAKTFTVACGTTISFSSTTYSNRNGIYKSATYTFTDYSGNKQVVTYTTEGSLYYISDMILKENKEVHANLVIGVTTALKSYGVTIQ